jgi:exosome complex component RRP42
MPDVIKEHLLKLISQGYREDGRKFDEYRPITIEYGVSAKSAEGSARVKIGKTEVVAGVKVEVGKPYPDTPEEGSIMVNAELLPMSNPEFESGPPDINAIELSRVVDRAIREGHAINFKKLCIKVGEKMWIILIDIYPINDEGNLFDAAALAGMAAIKDARFPKIEKGKEDEIVVLYGQPSNEKLPLERVPMSCTVWKVGTGMIVDPSINEEKMSSARLTVGVLDNGVVCALQKGGDEGLTPEELDQMIAIAQDKTKEMRKHFK